jgi:hypothetical protein
MPKEIAGLRYWELDFDKDGRLVDDGGLLNAASAGTCQDLVIFSHGWNSSRSSACALYTKMFELIAGMLPATRRATTEVAGVLWPSLLFPEDEPAASGPTMTRGGNAQNLRAGPQAQPLPPPSPSSGSELADALAPAFPGQEQHLRTLGALLDAQPQDPDCFKQFHELVKTLVTSPNEAEEDNGEGQVLTRPTREVLETMAGLAPTGADHAQGGNPFKLLWGGARELLRTASYYEMKNRAGVIGRIGLGRLLIRLHEANSAIKIHLMGHSFGARLVAFSLAGLTDQMNGPASPVKSLTLIQGAFSHFSFSRDAPVAAHAGALAAFSERVDGPLLCTYSTADRAVGWWYPNASRLARQDNQAVRAFNYRWGGMGYDGYQQGQVKPAQLQERGTDYGLQPGNFYRLDANDVIKRNLSWSAGAHSDICHPEVAWAVVAGAQLHGPTPQRVLGVEEPT